MNGLDPQMAQQLMQMLQQQNADPFQRPLPGDAFLPGEMPNPWSGGAPGQYQPQGELPEGAGAFTQNEMPRPGLPNFPKQMGGFGMGSMAPKVFNAPDFMNPGASPMQEGTDPFAGRPQNIGMSQIPGGQQMMGNPMIQQLLMQLGGGNGPLG